MIRIVALALALAACSPHLTAQSLPPPGRQARLDPVDGFWGIQSYTVELSQGVALAVTCHRGGPCRDVKVTSADPAIAEPRPASLSRMEMTGFTSQAGASAFVIVGKAPGTTTLTVSSKEGGRTIVVRVVPPPAVAAR